MEEATNKKNIQMGKAILIANFLWLGNLVLEIVTILSSGGGGLASVKRNIIGQVVAVGFSFFYAAKLRKLGKKNIANGLVAFGIFAVLIFCLELYLIIMASFYADM